MESRGQKGEFSCPTTLHQLQMQTGRDITRIPNRKKLTLVLQQEKGRISPHPETAQAIIQQPSQ